MSLKESAHIIIWMLVLFIPYFIIPNEKFVQSHTLLMIIIAGILLIIGFTSSAFTSGYMQKRGID